jgi:hypothetical protein
MPKEESGAAVTLPPGLSVPSGQRRGDPGPVYWASAAAIACAAAAPLPFFWAPPLWVAVLLAPPPLPALTVLGTVLRGLEPEEGRTTRSPAGCPEGTQRKAPRTAAARIQVASQGGVEDHPRERHRPAAPVPRGIGLDARQPAAPATGRAHRKPSALQHRAYGRGHRLREAGGSWLPARWSRGDKLAQGDCKPVPSARS